MMQLVYKAILAFALGIVVGIVILELAAFMTLVVPLH